MPKQVHFTREIIIREAVEIIRTHGVEALSARSISKKMGCSVAPLFRTYSNMEDLMDDVRNTAGQIVSSFLSDALNYNPAFKEFGLRLIRFSKEEPNLFHFLFLDKNCSSEYADDIAKKCLALTKSGLRINDEQALCAYAQIWPFVCGLAQLCSKNPEIYNDEYVSRMLSTQFQALVMLIKSDDKFIDVEPRLVPEGKRIYLRRWKQSDAAILYRLASDPELGPRAGWPPHKSEEDSLYAIGEFFLNDTTWAIARKDNSEIIGCIGFHLPENANIPLGPNEAEVGYWVARPYWNQGICTEALNVMIEHCIRLGTVNTLYGEHFTDNPASGKVMEKCGFADTGLRCNCPNLVVGSDKEVRVMKKSLAGVQKQ